MAETNGAAIQWLKSDEFNALCVSGYTRLDHCPEIVTACRVIAETIASMTIHLMANTDRGDQRIQNELSRKLDINPNRFMTRKTFVETLVMNELLYGHGNSVVVPLTKNGLLDDLVPIPPADVTFTPVGYGYTVRINGEEFDPDEVLHFTHNPDPNRPWMGKGYQVLLRDLATNLKQASVTEKGFMSSEYKPSLIVKVDGLTQEFAGVEGRKKLEKEFLEGNETGKPWFIPGGMVDVEQVRPLSLADLAISDMVQLNKRTIAAIIGVPPFVLGVGDFKQDAWNAFIRNTVAPIAKGIEQEMTRKLIIKDEWFLRLNVRSMYDYDLKTLADVYGTLSDKGLYTGNEVRDRLGDSPLEGLDELRILENYIPNDKIGDQKKLIQEE